MRGISDAGMGRLVAEVPGFFGYMPDRGVVAVLGVSDERLALTVALRPGPGVPSEIVVALREAEVEFVVLVSVGSEGVAMMAEVAESVQAAGIAVDRSVVVSELAEGAVWRDVASGMSGRVADPRCSTLIWG